MTSLKLIFVALNKLSKLIIVESFWIILNDSDTGLFSTKFNLLWLEAFGKVDIKGKIIIKDSKVIIAITNIFIFSGISSSKFPSILQVI